VEVNTASSNQATTKNNQDTTTKGMNNVTQLTGGQLLIKTLLANQVDSVFAIPGV